MITPRQSAQGLLSLPAIRQRIESHQADRVTPGPETRQAAVALVLREHAGHTQILFIKRAEKDGDPWSGQMAFPGGHLDAVDDSLKAAAARETLEEINLDLSPFRYLGPLNEENARARGRMIDMLIAPHVFEISGDPVFKPNYEVDDVIWADLDLLASNSLHDTITRDFNNTETIFNGYPPFRATLRLGADLPHVERLSRCARSHLEGPKEL